MIELKDLQKVINQKSELDIESLNVKAGEIAALVGSVDSGKDILYDLLIGKTRPTTGKVRLGEIDPFRDKTQFSQLVGVQFSEDNFYKRHTPYANLKFYCRLYRLPNSRIDEVLLQVGLADHADIKVEKLSSSLVRRLAFGRAILHKPAMLLLVDPFAKCDDTSVALLSSLMQRQADEGTALVIFTDDDTNLNDLCDSIYLLNQGRIVRSYNPQEERRGTMPFKIPVRLEGRVALVNPSDILYADATEGRAFLQLMVERVPTQFTLGELEERLSRSGFFRAHRGYLVNLQHIKEVLPYTRNSFSLRLDDENNTEIPLSKSAAAELKELLGY
ncbi:MAG TPA: LytTR family transcriptional regulator DNA-binding domain-containing protein [Anaerolineales bacterium]|nr:LytTR family transcriptional regulator DNA-binding domain-containing protein [Anaerolineales bacterium]